MKDRFETEIKINDIVLFNNQDYRGQFIKYEMGTVIGFTDCFVKIKPDNPKDLYSAYNKTKIYRKPENIFIIDDYKNKYLYLVAEFDNYKKNINKKANELSESGKRNVLLDIIDVCDNFDLALQNIKDETDKEGVQHILNQIDNLLKKYGVTKYVRPVEDSQLVDFDPNIYNALMTQETVDEEKNNKIAHIIKPGYTINNDILRIGQCIVYKLKE